MVEEMKAVNKQLEDTVGFITKYLMILSSYFWWKYLGVMFEELGD